MAITLFVYGTLKRGYRNHRRLMQAGCRYLGTAATAEPFSLWAAQVPYLLREDIASTPVQGELYEVEANQLPYLDNFEGHPNWYRRETITVREATGKTIQAEAYVFISRLPPGSMRLDGGVYLLANHLGEDHARLR